MVESIKPLPESAVLLHWVSPLPSNLIKNEVEFVVVILGLKEESELPNVVFGITFGVGNATLKPLIPGRETVP